MVSVTAHFIIFLWSSFRPYLLCLITPIILLLPSSISVAASAPSIFHTMEESQYKMDYLPQWLSALERHLTQDVPEGQCTDGFFNKCHLQNWFTFLEGLKDKSRDQQLDEVNRYANDKSYIIDLDNYGKEDYWAIAKEFLYNGGDCEDFAITKYFSLRWLGYSQDELRLLILQDTNLRVQHAVLVVFNQGQVMVLDNQSQQVMPQEKILHYVPLYSVNEKQWWLHVPPTR
jgi:predicted transglutaminase-like cysteine proteinase